jgi:hypothetical protein
VNVPNITVYAVSGKFLADGPLMVKTVSFFYGINATEAQTLVGTVQQVFEEFPVIGYDIPVWSLNVAAVTDQPDPEIMGDNSILMGDAGSSKASG